MIIRNYDAAINRWFDCVARGSHRFNSADTCMDCGAPKRGQTVKIVRGGIGSRKIRQKLD